MRNIFVFIFLLLLLAETSNAQIQGKARRREGSGPSFEVSVVTGPVTFLGDIKYFRYVPQADEWRFAAGFSAGYRLSALLGLRGSLLKGKMAGKQKTGNHRMENRFSEINLNGLFYLDNLFGEKRYDRFFQPYLIAGTGLLFYQTGLYTIQPQQKEKNGGKKTEGFLLLGMGIDFRINRQWSVSIESANRGVHSDYLDLWKSGYPYDVYNITLLAVKYRFGFSLHNERGYYPQQVIKRKTNRAF